ncbi:MAG: glycosyltransferase family 1 protein [Microbacterium sp.]|nr:glycosyltransferase family 1 protein [Microbacterium sp.]
MGALVRLVDRVWWYRKIRRSGLVDRDFYAAQLGWRSISASAATWHYVSRGFRRGLSLNPLFDEIFAGGGLPEVFRVPALYAYLVGERDTIAVNPWWDAVGAGGAVEGPALEHVWTNRGLELILRAGDRERRMTVTALRELAIRAAREWSSMRWSSGSEDVAAESTAPYTLVRFVQARDRRYHRKLEQVARLVQANKIAASAAMIEADASQWVSATVLSEIEPGIRFTLYRAPNSWGEVVASETRTVPTINPLVVLDARADFDDVEVESLAREGGSSVAFPAHRAQDGTLVGLGAARIGARTYRILRGHPVEDASVIAMRVLDVPIAVGRSFAMPFSQLFEGGGIQDDDEDIEALSLRMNRRGAMPRVLLDIVPVLEEPDLPDWTTRHAYAHGIQPAAEDDRQRAEEIISFAGFDVRGWSTTRSGRPTPALEWRRPHSDAQRWAIKICAPAGRAGAVWGDTHFARGLASALRRRGHMVVIDAYDARDRDSGYLDDVSVAIRGPYRMNPPRWGVSLEWIISHPDEVSRSEVARHDGVFAASSGWSERMSKKWGLSIRSLLEATDTDLFHPRGLERGSDIVFVGTARGIARPSVVAPLSAGIPVKVYGPDWRPFISQSAIAARSIPNVELPARYETAAVVLNDQWPAMRREGFIAMRPFDAVAVGGRVISEEVEDIEEIFHGAVVTYRDASHLVELLRTDPSELFPSDERLREIAADVRREHSFDARAAVLAAAAQSAAPVVDRARG